MRALFVVDAGCHDVSMFALDLKREIDFLTVNVIFEFRRPTLLAVFCALSLSKFFEKGLDK